MTRSLLHDVFAHHVWATERLLDACAVLTPEQLQTPAPGTYGSIIDTLRHLVASDSYYLSVLSGASTAPIGEEPSLAELRSVMAWNGRAWAGLLAGGIDPDEDRVDRDDDGTEYWNPTGIRLAQVIHHGTDHRSQICTALTSLGLTPPGIDLWSFAGATGRELVVTPPP